MFIFIQHTHAYIIVLEYQKECMPIFIHLLVGHSCLYSYNTHIHRVTIINNEHNNMYLVRLCRYSYTYQWVTHVRIHNYSTSNNCAVSYIVSIVNTLTHLIHIYSCIPYLHTLDTTVAMYYIACKVTFMHNMHHYGALYI